MKIIISPSKTQNISMNSDFCASTPIFADTADGINAKLRKFSKDELKGIYKASDKIVDEAYANIHGYDDAHTGQAIFSYTGAVFSNMQAETLEKEHIEYLNDTLVILSAHYGALRPFDAIKPYRLDYKMNFPELDLKDIWRDIVSDCLKGETIINLASDEFSAMITGNKIDVEFKELRDGKYKVIGTYAKMARGKMIRMIAEKCVTDIEQIKGFVVDGYGYKDSMSGDRKFVFVKG